MDLLILEEALERLRTHSERLAETVDYRFFGGLTYQEIAETTGRSVATIERDWVRARLWLYSALDDRDRGSMSAREIGVREAGSPCP